MKVKHATSVPRGHGMFQVRKDIFIAAAFTQYLISSQLSKTNLPLTFQTALLSAKKGFQGNLMDFTIAVFCVKRCLSNNVGCSYKYFNQ